MAFSVEVNARGPLFEAGRAQHVVDQALDEAKWDVGSQGLANWHQFLDASIRHPTPYYETQITVQRVATEVVVHDRGVVYGPWLEGVGSRNAPVTRFPGYHALRRAHQQLQRQAGPLVQRVFDRRLEELR
jgi:hypothetical protein